MASQSAGKASNPPSVRSAGSDTMRSARRKACDLCFTKKIKCDMLKPICSNCILYENECTTTVIRRRSVIPRTNLAVDSPSRKPSIHEVDLEARVARIEAQMQQVLNLDAVSSEEQTVASNSPNNPTSRLSPPPGPPNHWEHHKRLNGVECEKALTKIGTDTTDNGAFPLPLLNDFAPAIDNYFATFNTVTPLFQQSKFMQHLSAWYSDPSSHNVAVWASIHIVAALGLRFPAPGVMAITDEQARKATEHAQIAYSVILKLATRDDDILGVQVILGIIMFLLDNNDQEQAGLLIGSATKAVHRMRLYDPSSTRTDPPDEVEQKCRILWYSYILDKDLSLRTRTPSTLPDDDIDIPLPPVHPTDRNGLIHALDGRSQLNMLRTRIDLANIEGKVYDMLLSGRGAKVRGHDRVQRTQYLRGLLDTWYQRIPPLFRLEHLVSTLDNSGLNHMMKMYSAYQLAMLNIHDVYCDDPKWVREMSTITHIDANELAMAVDRMVAKGHRGYPGTTPANWAACVEVSRVCVKLFISTIPMNFIVWQGFHPYFAGLVLLLLNVLVDPGHPLASLDQHICQKALMLFENVAPVATQSLFTDMYSLALELVKTSTAAAEAAANTNHELDLSLGSFWPGPGNYDAFHG